MTTNDDQTTGQLPSKISRRTLAAGAAWSVPVIAVASAAPAYAVSGTCITYAPGSCKGNDQGDKYYRVKLCISSTCLGKYCPNGTLTITQIESNNTNLTLPAGGIVISLDGAGNGCMPDFLTLPSGNLASTLTYHITLSGCANAGSVTISQKAPPSCVR